MFRSRQVTMQSAKALYSSKRARGVERQRLRHYAIL